MKTRVKGDLTETQDNLLTFFDEKDLPEKLWSLQDMNGTTHFISSEIVKDALIFEASDEEREKCLHTIVQIDFKNGDVNHFLKHLAQGMIEARAEEVEGAEEERPWEVELKKPYNWMYIKDKESGEILFTIRGKDVGIVFKNEFETVEEMEQYVEDNFGEEIENLYQ